MSLRRSLFACVIALAALLPASARAQIQPGGSVLIDKTPIVGGTSGRCLYDNAGKIGETASCGLAGGITVGTSVITGGTTTRVLYDNAGVLGEYTNTQLTALINPATASLSGALPAWPNNTTTFFRGDGSYATLNFAALGGSATAAQMPAGTGDTSWSAGTTATTTTKINGVDQTTAWTPSTPAATCASGTPTTITTAMRSKAVGKSVLVEATVTLTNIGSCTGALRIPLPSTAQSLAIGSAVNANSAAIEIATIAASGTVISIFAPSTSAFPGTNGQEIDFSVVYESQ